jgi:predicted dehydrogenase
VFTDFADALAQKPDVAFITNPSSLHLECAMACANAGCDLFVEKPLSDSVTGIEQLIDVVSRTKLVAMVGYQLRFHPCFELFTDIVRSGRLGAALAVRATIGEYLPYWHRYENYREMYAARCDLGGGVIFSQIHEYDYLYSLFGLPERLFALGGHWSDLEIDVEDTADVLMECALEGRSLPVHVHQDFLQWPPARTCEFVADRGRATLDFQRLTVSTQLREQPEPAITSFEGFERNALFVREIEHFLECVATRREPVISLTDGFASVKIALAVKESIANRRAVALEESTHAL